VKVLADPDVKTVLDQASEADAKAAAAPPGV
jgi:hypothetical protein